MLSVNTEHQSIKQILRSLKVPLADFQLNIMTETCILTLLMGL